MNLQEKLHYFEFFLEYYSQDYAFLDHCFENSYMIFKNLSKLDTIQEINSFVVQLFRDYYK